MLSVSKCEMARTKLCRKSSFGHCAADNIDLEICPYLKAIEEVARMAAEQVLNEDDGK